MKSAGSSKNGRSKCRKAVLLGIFLFVWIVQWISSGLSTGAKPKLSDVRKAMKFFKKKGYYECKHCGYVLRKEDVIVSGYDSESSLRHVHCPRCGQNITTSSPFSFFSITIIG